MRVSGCRVEGIPLTDFQMTAEVIANTKFFFQNDTFVGKAIYERAPFL